MSQNLTRKTRLAPEDRIAEILASARIELSANGYENFLPAEVAARCGVSEATIYRYFPTKRDLLVRVAEDWFAEILQFEPEIAQQQDIFHQLRLVVRHSFAVVRKEPSLSRLVLLHLRSDPAYRSTTLYKQNSRFTATIRRVIEDGKAQGIFRQDCSPTLVRDMVFGAVEHRTWAYIRGQGDFSVDETADSISDIIYRGLSVTPPGLPETAKATIERMEAHSKVLNEDIQALKATFDGG